MAKAATPAHFPTGFVAGFNVEDPRLRYGSSCLKYANSHTISFPPRNTKPNKDKPIADLTLSTTLASSGIFNEEERKKVSKPRFKKSQLDSRRTKTSPGKPLAMTVDDNIIPILIIQKKVEGGLKDSLCGYTLIVPAGWGMQIWPSLTHTDARVGGIDQVEQFAIQVGASHFPESACPTSATNWDECKRRAAEEEERVMRRPKGKRPHYHSNLPLLPYLQKPFADEKKIVEESVVNVAKDGQLPTQPAEEEAMEVEKPGNTRQWFMTNELVRLMQNELKENRKEVQEAFSNVLTSLNVNKEVNVKDALVQAALVPVKRGYVDACGYVYDEDETVGRIAMSTYAMNEGKAVAVANLKAETYFDFYTNKSHLERTLSVQNNDDDTLREYRIQCLK